MCLTMQETREIQFWSLGSRKWQHTPVSSLGKFHEQRSLVYYSPWGRKESYKTEQPSMHARVHARMHELVKASIQDLVMKLFFVLVAAVVM